MVLLSITAIRYSRVCKIDKFLDADDRPILADGGSISSTQAKLHAECEFEKYRIIQDKLFESDFDRYIDSELNIPDIKE